MGVQKPASSRLLCVLFGLLILDLISDAHGQKFQYSKGWMPGGKRSGMLESFLSADEPLPAHLTETGGTTSAENFQLTPVNEGDLEPHSTNSSQAKRYPFHYYRIGKRGERVSGRYYAPGLARFMKLLPRLGVSTSDRPSFYRYY